MNYQKPPFPLVLLVDADTISSFLTKLILLEENLAREVQVLNSAESALSTLAKLCFTPQDQQTNCPDLILMDLQMPGMDGFGLLQLLLESGQEQLIQERVVLLSCSISAQDRARAEAYRVHDILLKPFSSTSFLNLLEQS
jgi:CheY-like chemotaxis protein